MAFKVMIWNVENLFLPGTKYGPKTQDVYDNKLDGLATIVKQEAPDILAIQEVGDEQAGRELRDRLGGQWEDPVFGTPDPRGIRVAWLSRLPVGPSNEVIDFPPPLKPVQSDDADGFATHMGRGALSIVVTSASGASVQLLTAHLKSKLLTYPNGRFSPHDEDERARFAAYALYRRAAEATAIRVWTTKVLERQGQTTAVVVCGDLNDTVQAATTQILLGPPGSEIGTRGFELEDNGDAERLWNLAPYMPEGKDYSRINSGRKELIDHILVSDILVKAVDRSSVATVIDPPLPSISESPTDRKNEPSSDHAPVVATFDI